MNMTSTFLKKLSVASAIALTLAACGGAAPSSTTPGTRVGALGGTVTSGAATLTIPAGALKQEVEIHLVESEPLHGVAHFQLEPRGLTLDAKATISVKSSAGSGPMRLVEMENETEHAMENEHEMEAEHGREAEIQSLDDVELRHMNTCAPACGAGLECDDGACKVEDPAAAIASANCPAGMELDVSDGVCKAHGGSGN
jgi:hypothetical protein